MALRARLPAHGTHARTPFLSLLLFDAKVGCLVALQLDADPVAASNASPPCSRPGPGPGPAAYAYAHALATLCELCLRNYAAYAPGLALDSDNKDEGAGEVALACAKAVLRGLLRAQGKPLRLLHALGPARTLYIAFARCVDKIIHANAMAREQEILPDQTHGSELKGSGSELKYSGSELKDSGSELKGSKVLLDEVLAAALSVNLHIYI